MPQDPSSYISSLYSALKNKVGDGVIDFKEFALGLKDEEKRKSVYEDIQKESKKSGADLIPYEQFSFYVDKGLKEGTFVLTDLLKNNPLSGGDVQPPSVQEESVSEKKTYQQELIVSYLGGIETGGEISMPTEAPAPTKKDVDIATVKSYFDTERFFASRKRIDKINSIAPSGYREIDAMENFGEKNAIDAEYANTISKLDSQEKDYLKVLDLKHTEGIDLPDMSMFRDDWKTAKDNLLKWSYKMDEEGYNNVLNEMQSGARMDVDWFGTDDVDQDLRDAKIVKFAYGKLGNVLSAMKTMELINAGYDDPSQVDADANQYSDYAEKVKPVIDKINLLNTEYESVQTEQWQKDLISNINEYQTTGDESIKKNIQGIMSKYGQDAKDFIDNITSISGKIKENTDLLAGIKSNYSNLEKYEKYISGIEPMVNIAVNSGDLWKSLENNQWLALAEDKVKSEQWQEKVNAVHSFLTDHYMYGAALKWDVVTGALKAGERFVSGLSSIPTIAARGVIGIEESMGLNPVQYTPFDHFHEKIADGIFVDAITPSLAKSPLLIKDEKTGEENWNINLHNALYNISMTATDMYLLIGGGAIAETKWVTGLSKMGWKVTDDVAKGLGIFSSSMALTTGNYYDEALAAGIDRNTAALYAVGVAGGVSALEMINPSTMILGRGSVIRHIDKFKEALVNGVSRKQANEMILYMLRREIGMETFQELSQMMFERTGRFATNYLLGEDKLENQDLFNETLMTAALTGVVTGLATGFHVNKSAVFNVKHSSLEQASKDINAFNEFVDKNVGAVTQVNGRSVVITKEMADGIKQMVVDYSNFKKNVPESVNEDARSAYANLLMEKDTNTRIINDIGASDTEKQKAIVENSVIDRQLEQLESGSSYRELIEAMSKRMSKEEAKKLFDEYAPNFEYRFLDEVNPNAVDADKIRTLPKNATSYQVLSTLFDAVFEGVDQTVKAKFLDEVAKRSSSAIKRRAEMLKNNPQWMENIGKGLESLKQNGMSDEDINQVIEIFATKAAKHELARELFIKEYNRTNGKFEDTKNTSWKINKFFRNTLGFAVFLQEKSNDEVTKFFQAMVHNRPMDDIQFSSMDVQSTDMNQKRFTPSSTVLFQEREDVDIVDGWYSPIEKRLKETKIEKQSATKWKSLIGSGDEAIYTGVKQWLESKNPQEQVTKQEIIDWMKDNRIQVVEVENEDSKFDRYQLPGGYNYKEILVTLPEKKITPKYSVQKDGDKYYLINETTGARFSPFGNEKSAQEYANKLNLEAIDVPSKDNFRSSHFSKPNILVHLRMNTRTDADGNKVLFLEEVQSDWGQTGKKEGFEKTITNERRKEIEAEIKKINDTRLPDGTLPIDSRAEASQRLSELRGELNKGLAPVKSAPFVTDTNAWVKLGLKVALREAVRQGANKIAWTTGEQQNDRYDLSKTYKTVNVISNEDGTYIVAGFNKDGENIFQKNDVKESEIEGLVGKEIAEKAINEKQTRFEGVDLKVGGKGMKGFYGSIEEGTKGIVGAVAESLFGQKVKTIDFTYGVGFRVWSNKTGEYLGSYDGRYFLVNADGSETAIIPENYRTPAQVANDLGMDLSDLQIVFNGESYSNKGVSIQPSIDVTPELMDSVSSGLPLFQQDYTDEEVPAFTGPFEMSAVDKTGVEEAMVQVFGLSAQEAKTVAEIYDAIAEGWAKRTGSTKDQWYRDNIESFKKMSQDDIMALKGMSPEDIKLQKKNVVRAATIFNNGKAIIAAISNPNVSSPLHELAHVYESMLSNEERAVIIEWARSSSGTIQKEWNETTSEFFARGFEMFLMGGYKLPGVSKDVQQALDNMAGWMQDIYRGYRMSYRDRVIPELSPKMIEIYSRMFGLSFGSVANKGKGTYTSVDEAVNDPEFVAKMNGSLAVLPNGMPMLFEPVVIGQDPGASSQPMRASNKGMFAMAVRNPMKWSQVGTSKLQRTALGMEKTGLTPEQWWSSATPEQKAKVMKMANDAGYDAIVLGEDIATSAIVTVGDNVSIPLSEYVLPNLSGLDNEAKANIAVISENPAAINDQVLQELGINPSEVLRNSSGMPVSISYSVSMSAEMSTAQTGTIDVMTENTGPVQRGVSRTKAEEVATVKEKISERNKLDRERRIIYDRIDLTEAEKETLAKPISESIEALNEIIGSITAIASSQLGKPLMPFLVKASANIAEVNGDVDYNAIMDAKQNGVDIIVSTDPAGNKKYLVLNRDSVIDVYGNAVTKIQLSTPGIELPEGISAELQAFTNMINNKSEKERKELGDVVSTIEAHIEENGYNATMELIDKAAKRMSFVNWAKYRFVDKNVYIKKIEKDLRDAGVNIPFSTSLYRNLEVANDKISEELDRFWRTIAAPLIKQMVKDGVDMALLGKFMVAQHVPGRNKHLGPKSSSGITNEEAARFIAGMRTEIGDTEMAKYEKYAKMFRDEIYGYRNRFAVEMGILNESDIKGMQAALGEFYVPMHLLKNYEDDVRGNVIKRVSGASSPQAGVAARVFKKAKGLFTQEAIMDPIAVALNDTQNMIMYGYRAESARALYQMFFDSKGLHEEDRAMFVTDNAPDALSMDEIFDGETAMPYEHHQIPGSYEPGMYGQSGLPIQGTVRVPMVVTETLPDGSVVRRVKHRVLAIHDKGLAKSIFQVNNLGRVKFLATAHNWMKRNFTDLAMSFVIANFGRDFSFGVSKTFAMHGASVTIDALKNSAKLFGPMFRYAWYRASGKYDPSIEAKLGTQDADSQALADIFDYVRNGGTSSISSLGSVDEISDMIASEAKKLKEELENSALIKAKRATTALPRALGRFLETLASVSDMLYRVSVYKALKEQKNESGDFVYTKGEAVSIAKNITTNFSRRGAWTGAINSWEMFMNAAIQGQFSYYQLVATTLAKDPKTGKRDKEKMARGAAVLGFWTSFGALTSLISYLISPDDWEREMMTSDGRSLTICLPGDIGTIKLPMAPGLGDWGLIGQRAMYHILSASNYRETKESAGWTALKTACDIGGNQIPKLGWVVSDIPLWLGDEMTSDQKVKDFLHKGVVTAFPTILEPGVDVFFNIGYHGKPIHAEQFALGSPKPVHMLNTKRASVVGMYITQKLAESTGGTVFEESFVGKFPFMTWAVNANSFDYLVNAYLGSPGRDVSNLIDMGVKWSDSEGGVNYKLSRIPGISAVYKEENTWWDNVEFYALTRKQSVLDNKDWYWLNKHFEGIIATSAPKRDDPEWEKWSSNMKRTVNGLINEQVRQIWGKKHSNLSIPEQDALYNKDKNSAEILSIKSDVQNKVRDILEYLDMEVETKKKSNMSKTEYDMLDISM